MDGDEREDTMHCPFRMITYTFYDGEQVVCVEQEYPECYEDKCAAWSKGFKRCGKQFPE